MSRRQLEEYLRGRGCEFHHHGGKHDVWWNPATESFTSVPRHRAVKKSTVRSICCGLGVPRPPGL
ncbi:MAG: type II toxin-antitoxin system HicA family toxin [Gemmataceae bacterium]|nr:type II toxin-antitoxin system HicA family toxin [Gemmataceae bacterium]